MSKYDSVNCQLTCPIIRIWRRERIQLGQSQPNTAIAPSLSSSLKLMKASGFLASACALAISVDWGVLLLAN